MKLNLIHWTYISDLQAVANTTTLQTTTSKTNTKLNQHIFKNNTASTKVKYKLYKDSIYYRVTVKGHVHSHRLNVPCGVFL